MVRKKKFFFNLQVDERKEYFYPLLSPRVLLQEVAESYQMIARMRGAKERHTPIEFSYTAMGVHNGKNSFSGKSIMTVIKEILELKVHESAKSIKAKVKRKTKKPRHTI